VYRLTQRIDDLPVELPPFEKFLDRSEALHSAIIP
jgi:hypothetical protein